MKPDLLSMSQELLREKLKYIWSEPAELEEKVELLASCWLNKWKDETEILAEQIIADWLMEIESFSEDTLKRLKDIFLYHRNKAADISSAEQSPEEQKLLRIKKLISRFRQRADERLSFIEKQWGNNRVFFQNKLLEYIWIVAHKLIPDKDLKLKILSENLSTPTLSGLMEIFREFEYRLSIYHHLLDRYIAYHYKKISFPSLFTEKAEKDEEWAQYIAEMEDTIALKSINDSPQRTSPDKGSYAKSLFFRVLDSIYCPGNKGMLNSLFRHLFFPLKLWQELNGHLHVRVRENPFLPDNELIKTFRKNKITMALNLFKCTPKKIPQLINRCLLEIYVRELMGLLLFKEEIMVDEDGDFFSKRGWTYEELKVFLSHFFRNLWLYCHIRDSAERIEPDESSTKLIWEHMARYAFITPFLGLEEIALDAGCGHGIGLAYLSPYVKQIIGFDKDINFPYGKQLQRGKNVNLIAMDIKDLALKGKKFDVISLFELIEHLRELDTFFIKLLPLLKEKGLFVVSTPNKDFFSPNMRYPWNPFHFREYNLKELKQFLKKFFKEVQIYGQHFKPKFITKASPDDKKEDFLFRFEAFRKDDFLFTRENLESAMNYIALCRGVLLENFPAECPVIRKYG